MTYPLLSARGIFPSRLLIWFLKLPVIELIVGAGVDVMSVKGVTTGDAMGVLAGFGAHPEIHRATVIKRIKET
jgi:hypothetical protein